jgi:hypothetical protein
MPRTYRYGYAIRVVLPSKTPFCARSARRLVQNQLARRDGLQALMVQHHGNISAIVRHLGKERTQIRRWIRYFGLSLNTKK